MSSEDPPALVSRTRTLDLAGAKHDHQIVLVDSEIEQETDTSSGSRQNPSWRRLARNPTHTSLKEQLQKRKYARFSQDKYDSQSSIKDEARSDNGKHVGQLLALEEQPTTTLQSCPQSEAVDFATQPDTNDLQIPAIVTEQPAAIQQMTVESHRSTATLRQTETDILYENQRGSFFCGIPLYSHSSLLNFDPAPWVNKDLQDSPVNITNAQVPDPSWVWAWKSWYVDMAGDVDEQGWQYSFAFGSRWSWHGSHPWLTSFARRRRWLRRRVKRSNKVAGPGAEGCLEDAHHLNNDYFTIHSRRHSRPVENLANPEMQLAPSASYTSFTSLTSEDEKLEDVNDIVSLERALKRATVDREKIDAIKAFVRNTRDEVFYLRDKIPQIMSTFVFQNSRRQLLEFLNRSARDAQEHREKHEADGRPEDSVEQRKIDHLLAAAEAASKQIQGLEYWSDRQHVLRTVEDRDDDSASEDDPSIQATATDIGDIKGISEKAETAGEVRVDRRLTVQTKGKEPAEREPPSLSQTNTPVSPLKRDADTIFIPD